MDQDQHDQNYYHIKLQRASDFSQKQFAELYLAVQFKNTFFKIYKV